MVMDDVLNGFSLVSTPTIYWKSRRRSGSGKNLQVSSEDTVNKTESNEKNPPSDEDMQNSIPPSELSERRKALFEPLEPLMNNVNGKRPSSESLLPPPDFESANYPKGWIIGKKRKLVNVDVVESMRRIAVQEMNRKDREIDGLNEQLEEDSKCLEHLQIQLVDEKSKRAQVERENAMLKDQVNMLMNMLQETEEIEEENDLLGDES
ncbi:hypothetical protein Lal_00021825 [Lupinus albus]|uniref:Uncharacterized protein n=1 Tax=Lupinus albus TaxID=3870 RepID=A0A6A5LTS4_LUPAL|nr:hypothetical protein Lalb_Chr25g0278731 [Lupinus albus]KAF1865824.1 hypothetical protein Lal_00021825 [Lupinus albus]